jgi:hypothetical protein
MFKFSQITETMLAAVAALIFTATAVGAAVGPAETGHGTMFAAAQVDGTVRG